MIILGIETSCDETAAAIIKVENDKIKILSNIVSSQIKIHKKYGGVIPELAAREHVLNIIPIINEALKKAKIKTPLETKFPIGKNLVSKYKKRETIDAIAVTTGPGLITSLQVGLETAKTLAYAWDIPIIPINHIEGHIYANFADISNLKSQISNLFPSIVLTVSGGHTSLILMEKIGKYKTLGQTVDDAAGEAFDKAAKLMGLSYPGGPEISKYAAIYDSSLRAERSNPKDRAQNSRFSRRCFAPPQNDIMLPRPMISSPNLNFSFSGLKTALLYKIQKDKNWKKRISEYCFEFQQAVIDVLIFKTMKAAQNNQVKSIMLTGGVSANSELRRQLKIAAENKFNDLKILFPDKNLSTDNATMIATAGYFYAVEKKFIPWQKLKADPNLELKG